MANKATMTVKELRELLADPTLHEDALVQVCEVRWGGRSSTCLVNAEPTNDLLGRRTIRVQTFSSGLD